MEDLIQIAGGQSKQDLRCFVFRSTIVTPHGPVQV